jgi:predicted deacetylase
MNNKKDFVKLIFILLFLIILILLVILFVIRNIAPRQVDDVNPGRFCEERLIDKSQTLMIIPLLNNISIADNKSWCDYILHLNKSLGIHGVYHNYDEFAVEVGDEYLSAGMEEFKRCFGFYPKIFEAPRLALNLKNKQILEDRDMAVRGYGFNIFHKVYHCTDFAKNSYLVKQNQIIDIF